jgi:hypothetical protein
MTKHYKFQVEVNGKCYKFREMKDICEFLGVSYGTLYNLRRNRLKCKHYTKSHLKDITITKIDYDKTHYKKKKEPLIKAEEYHQKLDDSYKLVISQDPAVQDNST